MNRLNRLIEISLIGNEKKNLYNSIVCSIRTLRNLYFLSEKQRSVIMYDLKPF